jgi:hypothetical protein
MVTRSWRNQATTRVLTGYVSDRTEVQRTDHARKHIDVNRIVCIVIIYGLTLYVLALLIS